MTGRAFIYAAGAIAASMLTSLPAAAQESTDPIKITLNDWTGQFITTNVMAEVLKKAGYSVELVQADYLSQFAGLETGDLTLAMEIWATTGKDAMDAATATGKVENLGEVGMQAKEEWWFPEYMKERCPGLPNWEALKEPACVEAFSIPETAPKGRYLSGPATWGGYDEERVAALGLDFEVVHAGTDAALFAELQSAYDRQAPVMLWVYAPHWAPAKFKGEWIEFPPYEPACYSDPKWGSNPDAAYDCGKPFGPIWKVAWSGMKDKWPGAHKAAKAMTLTNEEMNAMITAVDIDGKSVEAVVADWMAKNEARWQEWIKK